MIYQIELQMKSHTHGGSHKGCNTPPAAYAKDGRVMAQQQGPPAQMLGH